MTTKQISARILAAWVLGAGLSLGTASAVPPAPTADDMVKVQPKQASVAVSNLTPAELGRTKILPYPNKEQPVGYVLMDANNRPVRRFLAVGAQSYNILSFYQNGQEVYRETELAGGRQFRWLGANGSKVGLDTDNNGTVDIWEAISPEEVSREAFDAIQKRDVAKLQALMVSAKDLQAIGLPEAQSQALLARGARLGERLNKLAGELKLADKAKWVHVELWAPETIPADEFQGRTDLVRHRNAGVLVDKGVENQAVTFQLGEMIQVGRAWKLIDGPASGSPSTEPTSNVAPFPKEVQALITVLNDLKNPGYGTPTYGKYQLQRGTILNDIVTNLQNHPQQELFVRQLIDAHVSAAEAGEDGGRKGLAAWQAQIEKAAKGTPLAGFATFRALGLDYSTKLSTPGLKPAEIDKVQTWWRDSLGEFIKSFPNIEETPEAHYRLALAEEPRNRAGEEAAKAQYAAIVKNFPTHQLATQAAGSIRRLDSEGQPMELNSTTLDGKPFGLESLKGSVVAVYYWGSFHGGLKADAKELDDLQKKLGGRLKVVTVCLDTNAQTAAKAAQTAGLPGVHLFSAEGTLQAQYGIIGTHLMLVGKEGKVANKNAQISYMADEVEKLAK